MKLIVNLLECPMLDELAYFFPIISIYFLLLNYSAFFWWFERLFDCLRVILFKPISINFYTWLSDIWCQADPSEINPPWVTWKVRYFNWSFTDLDFLTQLADEVTIFLASLIDGFLLFNDSWFPWSMDPLVPGHCFFSCYFLFEGVFETVSANKFLQIDDSINNSRVYIWKREEILLSCYWLSWLLLNNIFRFYSLEEEVWAGGIPLRFGLWIMGLMK